LNPVAVGLLSVAVELDYLVTESLSVVTELNYLVTETLSVVTEMNYLVRESIYLVTESNPTATGLEGVERQIDCFSMYLLLN